MGDYEPMRVEGFDAPRAAQLVAANLTGCFAPVGHVLDTWRRGRGHLAFIGCATCVRALHDNGAFKVGMAFAIELLAVVFCKVWLFR